jgi:acetyltransferase-like isoleucine patch superfamily enzyme
MISSFAVVQTDRIGSNIAVQEYAVIRPGAVLGDNVIIHPHVVIEEDVIIGDGVEIFPGTHVGKLPKATSGIARTIAYESRLTIGPGCVIGPHVTLYYHVVIGANTLVGDGASIREKCRVGERCVVGRCVCLNYNTIVGDDVKIMDHSWLCGNMTVGNRVFISGGVMTTNDNNMGTHGYNEQDVIGPSIGDGVKIGAGAILLPRVVIGENAVIAAGAIVTKDVAPNKTVKGVPARVSEQRVQLIAKAQV